MSLKQNNDWDGKEVTVSASASIAPYQRVIKVQQGSSNITLTLPSAGSCPHGTEILIMNDYVGTNTGTVAIATLEGGPSLVAFFPTGLFEEGAIVAFRNLYGKIWVPSGGGSFAQVVTDGGMDATPGRRGELAFNTADSKLYVCTTAGKIGTAVWTAQT